MDETKKSPSAPPTVEELKNLGNDSVKNGKYIEAVMHYTQAIKMDPNNYVLYSNRSFAFLKLDQHYLSLQDANETVRLQPQWAKFFRPGALEVAEGIEVVEGSEERASRRRLFEADEGYFRRAEVEAASELYDEALISYTRALQLDLDNPKLMESIKKITEMQAKKLRDNQNIIWISTCIGLAIGIFVVIMDYTLTQKPTLSHPFSMVAFSLALAGMGWSIGKGATLMNTWNAGKSLSPPEDLGTNNESEEKETMMPEKKKYSKAQARQRYKQGKL